MANAGKTFFESWWGGTSTREEEGEPSSVSMPATPPPEPNDETSDDQPGDQQIRSVLDHYGPSSAKLERKHDLEMPTPEPFPLPPSQHLIRIWSCAADAPPRPQPTAEVYATRFFQWLYGHPYLRGRQVLAADLRNLYQRWCAALGWPERPWNRVASHLSPLMGGARCYTWHDGQRLRVYEVPLELSPKRSDVTPPSQQEAP
jgi:hypothetical protein